MGQYEDSIANLPVDDNEPKHEEIQIVNTLFKEHKSTLNKLVIEVKDLLIIGILFILLSLPQTDSIIQKVIPSSVNSIYILVGIKALLIMLVFWLIKYFYLSKK